jgi:hypothetical protein
MCFFKQSCIKENKLLNSYGDEIKIIQFYSSQDVEHNQLQRKFLFIVDNTYFFVEVSVAEREIFSDLIKIDREKQVKNFGVTEL